MHHEIGGWLWLFIDVGLVTALAGALIYGILQWRHWQHHPAQKRARDPRAIWRQKPPQITAPTVCVRRQRIA